jgi:hypothetical protein
VPSWWALNSWPIPVPNIFEVLVVQWRDYFFCKMLSLVIGGKAIEHMNTIHYPMLRVDFLVVLVLTVEK